MSVKKVLVFATNFHDIRIQICIDDANAEEPINAVPVAKFIVPDWGDKVDSGIGLSYWHDSQCSLACR
jgi:hypothetical protein